MKFPGKKNTSEQVNLQDIVIAEDIDKKQSEEIRELLNRKRQEIKQGEIRLEQKKEELRLCAVRQEELVLEQEKGSIRRKKQKKLLIAAIAVVLLVNGAGIAYGEWGRYQYRKETEKERINTIQEKEALENKASALQEEIMGLRKQ